MKEVDLFKSQKHLIALSFLCMFFITYPNVMWIPWNVANLQSGSQLSFWGSFIFRCVFFFNLFYFQIGYNIKQINNSGFAGRFGKNILYSFIAGVLFLAISYLVPLFGIQSGTVAKHLTFQFLVVSLLCTFIGYISDLNNAKRQKEKLIEQLKIESLQSRYDALANQINPHFFFNSLGAISSLVRKGNDKVTLEYVAQLSDIFRYILQSDRKQFVSLSEEMNFVNAFSHVMEVRFGGKLYYNVNVDSRYKEYKLPVLSLLPLLENITGHNRIDSDHKMNVDIFTTADGNLIVENAICPKSSPVHSTGTGLENLRNRFRLLCCNEIKVESDDKIFRVILPLKKYESSDC